jgi:optic atrophy protein 1
VNLTLVSADEWEQLLRSYLWNAISTQVFDQILMPASTMDNAGSFNTLIDIKLKHWAEKELANKSIQVILWDLSATGKIFLNEQMQVGWQTLSQIFRRQVEGESRRQPQQQQEDLLSPLKNALVQTTLSQHNWDPKALDYLVGFLNSIVFIILMNAFASASHSTECSRRPNHSGQKGLGRGLRVHGKSDG